MVRYRTVDVGSTLGRLTLLELLGEGGMATVFRAHDKSLRRDVAVKVLFPHLARKPEVVSRFHREARAAAALDHPNILRVLDVGGGPDPGGGESSDPPYMVLELIKGGSLRDLSSDGEPILAESVAAIGAVLCRALAVAHDAGIIHRDIKPANVMASDASTGTPRLVIADFGVAHVADEDSVVTRTGALLGTPAYMSPEQAMADPLDARSDLYSVGATLYRLATGVMPFTGPTAKVVTSILTGDFIAPLRRRPAIGPDLAKVISRLMATKPEDRPASAEDAERDLLAVLEAGGIDFDEAMTSGLLKSRTAELRATVLTSTLDRAEKSAAKGEVPSAIALADRALALDSKNARALEIIESLGGASNRMWLYVVASLGLVAAVVGGVFAFGGFDRGGDEPELALVVADGGASDAPSAEPVQPIGLDPTTGPSTNPAVSDAAPPRRPIDAGKRRATSPDVRPTRIDARPPVVAIDAGTRADAASSTTTIDKPLVPVEDPPGSVTMTVATYCDLSINGVPSGQINRRRTIPLPPGEHKLVCSRDTTPKVNIRKTVRVRSGQKHMVAFVHKVRVRVSVADGVEVGGRFIKSGSSFMTEAKRIRVVVRRGSERAKVFVNIREACTLRGPKLVCDPDK